MSSLKSLLIIFFIVFSSATSRSQTTYRVVEDLDVKVTMRDGIRLSTNIYRPDTAGVFPSILIRTPYGNGSAGNKDGHFFAQHGYVYIVQDVRGRYESEGQFYAMQSELKDGYDMQQWTGGQPWSNGKIGTAGGSYVGFTQWMPAPMQSPYLKTMIPAVTFSDLYSTVYQNGAFFLGLFAPWSMEMTQPFFVQDDFAQHRMDSVLLTLPLVEMDKAMGWRVPFLRDWLSHPVRDKFWEATNVGDNYPKITASVYNIGGWFDILLKGTLENYLKMTSANISPEIRKKQKLFIGPWVHNWGKREVGELDFGEEASFKGRQFQLRWFDNQLKDIDNGAMEEPPVKIFVMGANKWRFENEWPLARTNYQKYYLHSKGKANSLNGDGGLSIELAEKGPSDKFTYDPADPVISKQTFGPYDQTYIEKRDDVLIYTTPNLKTDVEVTGPVKVILFASSSAINTDFTAKLVDVYPDGRAMRVCEGIIRASHRNPEETPSNIEPGKIYEYIIDMWATSNLFKKGHQIRVEISSSNFPRFDRNLNTGNHFATDITMVKADQKIYHDEEYPSCIVLPVIED
jgi:hypothetical protein